MIAALLLVIGAFRLDFAPEKVVVYEPPSPDARITLKEVTQTEHARKKTPPPPEQPPPPIEEPDRQALKQERINLGVKLDLDQPSETSTSAFPPSHKKTNDETVKFVVVEEKPQLIGGIAQLQKEARYPAAAQRAGIEGTVYVEFTVTRDGEVEDLKVLRSPHETLSEEALRVIREEASFEPGKQRNRPVNVRMSLPIRFSLE